MIWQENNCDIEHKRTGSRNCSFFSIDNRNCFLLLWCTILLFSKNCSTALTLKSFMTKKNVLKFFLVSIFFINVTLDKDENEWFKMISKSHFWRREMKSICSKRWTFSEGEVSNNQKLERAILIEAKKRAKNISGVIDYVNQRLSASTPLCYCIHIYILCHMIFHFLKISINFCSLFLFFSWVFFISKLSIFD